MPCPYRSICSKNCPGGTDYEPQKGTLAEDEGIRCLDFDKLLPYRLAFPPRKLPGPRHVVDGAVSAEKQEQARKAYARSSKGKAAQSRWARSEKGRQAQKRYQDSDKFKLTQLRYRESRKGKQTRAERQRQAKIWRRVHSWLKEHPDKTLEDYFIVHPEDRA